MCIRDRGSDLVDAVRRVNAGENLIEATVVHRMRASMARDSLDPRLAALTAQERRILCLLYTSRCV